MLASRSRTRAAVSISCWLSVPRSAARASISRRSLAWLSADSRSFACAASSSRSRCLSASAGAPDVLAGGPPGVVWADKGEPAPRSNRTTSVAPRAAHGSILSKERRIMPCKGRRQVCERNRKPAACDQNKTPFAPAGGNQCGRINNPFSPDFCLSGADLTFATYPAANSRSECQIQSSTRNLYIR